MLPFTLKTTAKLAQYHHMTSHQEKDFSRIAVRVAESLSQHLGRVLCLYRSWKVRPRDRLHRLPHSERFMWFESDINVVQINLLILRVPSLKLPSSCLAPT